jgi:hypothetical protein
MKTNPETSSSQRCTKFLRDSLPLAVNVLRLVEGGNYPAKIARLLGKSRQHVYYYCKKLEKMGYLRRTVRDAAVFYELTQPGKEFLTRGEGRRGFGRVFRLHAFGLKFPVVVDRVGVDWGRVVRLRNWSKFVGSFCGLTVERTPGHVIVYADVLEGDDPYELMFRGWLECVRLASYLEEKFGVKFGVPKLKDPRPHFAVWDPVAGKFSEYVKVSDDVGDIDRSPPYRTGEIDWHDPSLAKDYLLMPTRVKSLEGQIQQLNSRLQSLEAGLTTIMQTWNLVGNRLLEILSKFEKSSEPSSHTSNNVA